MYRRKMRGYIAPVSVVAAIQGWSRIVLGSADALRDERISPIRADHDPSVLVYITSRLAMAADPRDLVPGINQFCDCEALSDFRACLCGGIQQELVQHHAPWGTNLGHAFRGRQISR